MDLLGWVAHLFSAAGGFGCWDRAQGVLCVGSSSWCLAVGWVGNGTREEAEDSWNIPAMVSRDPTSSHKAFGVASWKYFQSCMLFSWP